MHQQTVAIASRSGLHARPASLFVKAAARPASLFVKAAARQPVKVTIAREGRDPVDARSMLAVLALAAPHGENVVLSAEGDGARAAVEELAELLAQDLDAT